MKEPFKVGDRVRIYGYVQEVIYNKSIWVNGATATVEHVTGDIIVAGDDSESFEFHRTQCRRLKPRVKVWPQYYDQNTGGRRFYMTHEDFNRLSPKQRKLLGVDK